ncbi:MAG: hypothetical protein N3A63_04460 [Bacteroidetes bacterium]|nr:hypothetical protein [Bacteroidota bacterium]
MATKPPVPVKEFPAESLEKKVYALAATIPTVEPNDQMRLAYNLWAWLVERKGTLADAVHAAGVRSSLTEEEITQKLEEELKTAQLL